MHLLIAKLYLKALAPPYCTSRAIVEPRAGGGRRKLRTAAGAPGFEAYSVQDTNCTGCDVSPLCGPTYWVGCETQ